MNTSNAKFLDTKWFPNTSWEDVEMMIGNKLVVVKNPLGRTIKHRGRTVGDNKFRVCINGEEVSQHSTLKKAFNWIEEA